MEKAISVTGAEPPTLAEDSEARRWEYLAHAAVEVERNRWFIAAIVGGLLACAAVGTLAMLLPLKQLVPLAVTVDSRTGLVTSVEYAATESELTQRQAIQRSDVAKYVIARETYDPQDLATNERLVRVMSDGRVWEQYANEISPDNALSPISRYGWKLRRRIDVRTVLPLPDSQNTYQVRYVAIEEPRDAQARPAERAYIATVRFQYSPRPLSNEDRILNPLNFRATAYRTDQEIAAPIPTQSKGAAK
ncbi:MAG: hypothetical protein IVW54_14905 [Candidatus Binataceae bacterium]|nr:hypothetical protein [Candidatus Binataceae bacterium]